MKESVHCCRLFFFWHLLTSARPRIGLPLLRSISGWDCSLISLPVSLSPRSQTKSASPRSPPRQTETRWTWRPSASSPRSSLLPSPVSSTLPKNCPCSPRWVEVNGFSGSELGVTRRSDRRASVRKSVQEMCDKFIWLRRSTATCDTRVRINIHNSTAKSFYRF